ncbi:MAG TPA: hypothetical protein VK607_09585 [Kofleriaceae bacterium]|nr:hypothetical protein [Kofleriaceae bacterium]
MPRFTVQPHAGGFRPGIDAGKLNELVDQLEVEDFLDEASTVAVACSSATRSGAPGPAAIE